MKKVIIAIITMALVLLPLAVYAQSDQNPKEAPPVSQALVPEGDFALKLATVLKLGTPASEAQAEDMLTSVGIAPRNGWIADYPVTPDIIGELQDAVATAADSKKLPMGKEETLKAFQDLTTEFGLAVLPGGSDTYAENQPQPDPAVINNYYYEEGPPVVTYYPPPPDYGYLYGWVPYPFWHSGFFFGGFFVLHDFHRVVFVGHRRCVISNHLIHPVSKTVVRIDPVGRRTGEGFRTRDISRNRGFNSTEARRGADSIFQRSRERAATMTTDQGSGRSRFARPRAGGRSEEQRFTNKGNNTRPFNSGSDRSVRQPSNSERRNDMNSRASSSREGRSFSGPSVTSERSFSSPSAGSRSFRSSESSGRSFSAPARSFSGPSRGSSSTCANCHRGNSSFGRGGGGSSPRSFSGSHSSGGFSGGRSSGGISSGRSFGGSSGGRSSGGFSGGRSSGGSSGGGFSGGRGGGGSRGGGGRGR